LIFNLGVISANGGKLVEAEIYYKKLFKEKIELLKQMVPAVLNDIVK
jgi:hypothetical protein